MVHWYDLPELAGRHLPHVLRYLDHELGRLSSEGLSSGVLGDYLAPGERGTPSRDDLRMAASCYLYRALTLTADLIERVGWSDPDGSDQVTRLRRAAASLARAVDEVFLDRERGCYTSEREPAYRQTTNVLPVAMGITPTDQVQRVVDRLAADLRERGAHHDAGCLGLSELFGVLTAHGHADLALEVATQRTAPGWGAWMLAGHTTMLEMWGDESRSLDHYFMGAMAAWLYDSVAGVRLLAPGWREFAVEPGQVPVDSAAFHYQGPHGRLGAAWRRSDDVLTVTVTVPPGSRARLHLPGREPSWLPEGEWTETAALTASPAR
ncbi:alpha-L-rhamnosidase-related protein [Auraticoccus cholistanensis]|uniref:alpha-L-rhamnosidase-related protein n=1 Tax=Auraticoccus cholistanensis TaxID=2656650 RepID=UPI0022B226EA|nr:alpha-L-rhamnosidase C-terminal domain-containing protein [Auraticoccus cholistanensis]